MTWNSVSGFSPASYARIGVSLALHPAFRLRAEGLAAYLLRDVEIDIAGSRVATWGRPVAGGALTLEVSPWRP